MVKNKRIIVFGGAGSIGSELVRQLSEKNAIYVVDIDDVATFDLVEELKMKGRNVSGRCGDIRNKETVEEVFSDFKPQYVFHAAAYKVVTSGEQQPMEYIQTNVVGLWNVIGATKKYPVEKFVFISSDKAATGNSVMGITKKMGEVLTRNQKKGYVVVRFGNVLGSRGSVIPLWQGQIDRGEAVTVTDPRMERYMMTIPEAVSLVIKAAEEGAGGEIFILDTGRKVNVLQLAQDIIKQSGKEIPIKMIGVREGETLTEKWMSDDEEKKAIRKDNFWIIPYV